MLTATISLFSSAQKTKSAPIVFGVLGPALAGLSRCRHAGFAEDEAPAVVFALKVEGPQGFGFHGAAGSPDLLEVVFFGGVIQTVFQINRAVIIAGAKQCFRFVGAPIYIHVEP